MSFGEFQERFQWEDPKSLASEASKHGDLDIQNGWFHMVFYH